MNIGDLMMRWTNDVFVSNPHRVSVPPADAGESAGHTVIAVDLPGDGSDDTPPEDVTTMRYAERAAALIDQTAEPVIVVGHSMGGTVAAQVSELRSTFAPSCCPTANPSSTSTTVLGKTG